MTAGDPLDGSRPPTGARYIFFLVESTDSALVYRGCVHLPAADIAGEVHVRLPAIVATATLGEGSTPAHARAAAAHVRSAVKAGLAEVGAPPRRVARWRA